MLKQYVDNLLQNPPKSGVLQAFRDDFPFEQYTGSDEYLSELNRLTNHNHYDGSVVDIIGDRSSIIIIDDDRFTVSLSKRNNSADYVYTQPAEVLIVSLSHPDSVEIQQFWGDNVAKADPLSPRSKTIDRIASANLSPFQAWIPPARDNLFRIGLPANNSIWLTVYGKRLSPYFHAYSLKTFNHLFSAFSSHTVASSYYLAEILFHAVNASSGEEEKNISGFINAARSLAQLGDMPVTGLWRIAEAMAPIEPELAISVLKSISAKGDVIGHRANVALQNLGVSV